MIEPEWLGKYGINRYVRSVDLRCTACPADSVTPNVNFWVNEHIPLGYVLSEAADHEVHVHGGEPLLTDRWMRRWSQLHDHVRTLTLQIGSGESIALLRFMDSLADAEPRPADAEEDFDTLLEGSSVGAALRAREQRALAMTPTNPDEKNWHECWLALCRHLDSLADTDAVAPTDIINFMSDLAFVKTMVTDVQWPELWAKFRDNVKRCESEGTWVHPATLLEHMDELVEELPVKEPAAVPPAPAGPFLRREYSYRIRANAGGSLTGRPMSEADARAQIKQVLKFQGGGDPDAHYEVVYRDLTEWVPEDGSKPPVPVPVPEKSAPADDAVIQDLIVELRNTQSALAVAQRFLRERAGSPGSATWAQPGGRMWNLRQPFIDNQGLTWIHTGFGCYNNSSAMDVPLLSCTTASNSFYTHLALPLVLSRFGLRQADPCV